MSELNACLFDLDGVIVDTAKFHYIAWRELANGLGFDLTEKQNEKLKGVSRVESLEIILKIGNVNLDPETKAKLAATKNDRYLELCQKMTPDDILPGVQVFLDSLIQEKIKIGLGSASKNARLILDYIGLTHYFATIVDGNRINKGKPDPETFLLGAEDLDVNPQNCIVFEDAVAGIQAAKAGGMVAVGIGSSAELNAANADLVIPGFQDIDVNTIKHLF
ncbi:beta-phosphoglucomutase [Persicitalea jodogahamensis]|uniref:Beta-phosphoglucomutase n=1 Tax=Persicitalea jodogahamensis TaxID=402147 RepID=A0A8J3DCB0_9BACT|nr:beta-phosphoglucomutase [Persicitalea jodogahamensis]GHB81567.1 beta-phosphoglucomutase [Persicitalea jodogahamensis]